MRKNLIAGLKILLVFLLLLAVYNYKLIEYGISQLRGQLHIIRNAIPVESVLTASGTPDSIRTKLLLTSEIRKFAMDSLDLKNSKNYTTFFDQKGKPLMWVVTGCLPYELKAKEWWFPFLGNVSYKGFFKEEKALEEAQKLRNQGFETDIYSPSAWSTLGFFRDPIFSNMLNRREGRLAELIIHELTHATIYLESSVEFNENLATFIGEKGAEHFLLSKYGPSGEAYQRYVGYLSDENIYSAYMMESAKRLDSLYKSFPVELPVNDKATKKYRMIAEIMSGLKTLPFSYPERYRFDFNKSRLPNNTEFMAFLRYRNKQHRFNEIYREQFNNDLKLFIKTLKENPDFLFAE